MPVCLTTLYFQDVLYFSVQLYLYFSVRIPLSSISDSPSITLPQELARIVISLPSCFNKNLIFSFHEFNPYYVKNCNKKLFYQKKKSQMRIWIQIKNDKLQNQTMRIFSWFRYKLTAGGIFPGVFALLGYLSMWLDGP